MPDTLINLPPLSPPDLSEARERLRLLDPIKVHGRVQQVIGLVIESVGPAARVGEVCEIHFQRTRPPIFAEVVGFRQNRVLLMPLGEMEGITPGSLVVATGMVHKVPVGDLLLGRVLDGLGRPMDGGPAVFSEVLYPVHRQPPNALARRRITDAISLGVRTIDSLLTVGKGQRIGIFAGSGVGKSTLLGMIARYTSADVNVIALTGERGREVREFIEEDLGEEGLKRSVVVVATSDQPALLRIKAAMVATTIAEYFRDQGLDVLLMMDSVTRLALAQREVGLAIGEPPATRGYTPSVFAMLPRLLERAGTSDRGTITGLYTVLVEADDMNEPVADTVRGILDGHIVLSRALAHRNHYPAIDVLASVSRVMPQITDSEHQQAAAQVRQVLADYTEAEDLINIGAYQQGSNPNIDHALRYIDKVRAFLQQGKQEGCLLDETIQQLKTLFAE